MNSILDLFIQPQNTWNEGEDLVLKSKKISHPEEWIYKFLWSLLCLFVVYNVDLSSDKRWIGVLVFLFGILALFIYFIVQDVIDGAKRHDIIISGNGIQTGMYDVRLWNTIDYAYIVYVKKAGNHLSIEQNINGEKSNAQFDLRCYKYKKEDLEKAIAFWSKRPISKLSDKHRDEFIAERNMTGEERQSFYEMCLKSIPILEKGCNLKSRLYLTALITFFTVHLILFIIFTDLSDDRQLAIAAFTALLILIIAGFIRYFIEDVVRRNPIIEQLTDSEYNDICTIVSRSSSFTIKRGNGGIGFWIFFLCASVAAFISLYFAIHLP